MKLTIHFFMIMKRLIFIFTVLLSGINVFGQVTVETKKASKIYNVKIEVESCKDGMCGGKLTVEVFKKNSSTPFQTFNLEETEFLAEEAEMTNAKRMYDYQSVIFFEDYNFDGIEDLGIRDGNYSGYGGPSYQLYLFSPKSKKFIHSQPFTELAQGEYLGMFEVDKKRKILTAYSKGGCCMHSRIEFSVVNNRPKKVFEEFEDATIADEKRVRITTSRLVNGKWRTSVKYVKRQN